MIYYEKKYSEAICIVSGDIDGHHFEQGEIYPLCGWNNGVHIVYCTGKGDTGVSVLLNINEDIAEGDDTTPRFRVIHN